MQEPNPTAQRLARLVPLVTAALTWGAPATTHAHDPFTDGLEMPPAAGAYTHDGWLLRAQVGLASVSGHQRTRVETVSASGVGRVEPSAFGMDGAGLLLSVDAGFALVENLVVHGRLSELLLPNPSFEREQGAGWTRPRQASFVLLAPAVTYYLMPLHLHATAAAGVAFADSSEYDGDDSLSRPGFGGNLDLGWDAWIEELWSIGLGARLWYAAVTDDGPAGHDLELSSLAAGALLGLTHQ